MNLSDWRYTIGMVSGGHFLSHLYLLSLPPLFPLLRAEFGWNSTELGLAVSAMSLGGLLQPIVGSIVDRIGAKHLLVVGLMLTSTAVGLIGIANSFTVVIVFSLLSGLGQSVFHPANYAMIDAAASNRMKGKCFSSHVLSGYLGFAAAPLLVGSIGLLSGWRTALFVVGAFGPLFALLILTTVEPVYLRQLTNGTGGTTDVPWRDHLRTFMRPATIVLFSMFLIITVADKGIQSFTGLFFLEDLGLSEAVGNTALTVFFAAVSCGIVVGGVVADRRSPRAVIGGCLMFASLVLAAGILLRAELVQTTAIALYVVVGGCYGLALPSRDRLVNAVAPAGSTGRTFGFVFAGISLGGVIGPAMIGALIDATTVTTGFYAITTAFGVAVILTMTLDTGFVPLSRG